ncbi:hypothetical protein [Paenibacillus sambharensis]|nr:hypothetical protein [Paenibacillus sambharensis]
MCDDAIDLAFNAPLQGQVFPQLRLVINVKYALDLTGHELATKFVKDE